VSLSWLGLVVILVDVPLQFYFRFLGRGVENSGVSFGWLAGLNTWLVVLIYLIFILWAGRKLSQGKKQLAWSALALGGLGNLIPRLWLGGVWDYIYFAHGGFWFNLSDALITVGVVLYMWSEIPRLRSE